MTRFDAVAGGTAHSTWRDVRSVISAQPAVFAVTVAVGCVAVAIAIGVLAIGQGVLAQFAMAIGRTQVSVFLSPQLARSDAEGLRGRIQAIPAVAGAVLKAREEALTALVGDGLPALSGRPNPLPDVWIVTLRPSTRGTGRRPLSSDVSAARDALAALPGVASVFVDERWIAALDRWTPLANRVVGATNLLVFVALAGLLTCLGFVAARASGLCDGVGLRAFATVGLLSGTLSVLIAAVAVWGIAASSPVVGVDLASIIEPEGGTMVVLVAGVGVIAILAPLVGMLLGRIKR